MKVEFTASTAATIVISRDGDLYHARLKDVVHRPEVCLAVDLFEVIAELSGLDLDQSGQAAEALELAAAARAELNGGGGELGAEQDDDDLCADTVS
jgi:hypothetical protein